MGLAKRIIPCLDIDGGRVVKGVRFVNLRDAGDPAESAARYDREGADELVFLDITASVDKRETLRHTVRSVAEQIRIPLTVGGGVRAADDAMRLLQSGADKISINTAAVLRPQLLAECAGRFGAQCTVLAIDARRWDGGSDDDDESGGGARWPRWQVVTHGGRTATGRDVVQWAREAERLGAGEILLTSMDADGAQDGYDIALTRAVADAVGVPVIASGGAGCPAHMADALTDGGAHAALAASIFHDGVYRIAAVKDYLAARGIEARQVDG